MPRAALLLVLLAVLAVPARAGAQSGGGVNAPPGNSGVDQYLETIPDARGNRFASGERAGRSPLSQAAKRALQSFGPTGRAVEQLTDATAVDAAAADAGRMQDHQRGSKGREARPPAPSGAKPAGEAVVENAVRTSGAGGLGLILPLILGASLAGAAGFLIMRRR